MDKHILEKAKEYFSKRAEALESIPWYSPHDTTLAYIEEIVLSLEDDDQDDEAQMCDIDVYQQIIDGELILE